MTGIAVGFVAGMAVGLAYRFTAGLTAGLVVGLVVGSAAGFNVSDAIPAQGLRFRIDGRAGGLALVTGFLAGLVLILAGGLALALRQLGTVLVVGLVVGLVAVLVVGLVFGRTIVPSDLTKVASPAAALGRDRQAALVLILALGLALGLAAVLSSVLLGGVMCALATGFGLGASRHQTAWPGYIAARSWLALRHQLPWSLMAFLDEAHQRGVLRQVGSVYQFRHIDLQRRLANHPARHLLPASGKPSEVVPNTRAPGSAL